MIPFIAMAAEQLSALIFIGILVIAGAIVLTLSTKTILHNGDGSDVLYRGVVIVLGIGIIGAIVTALVH